MRGPSLDLATWSALLAALAYTRSRPVACCACGSFAPQKGPRLTARSARAVVASAAWGWAGVLGRVPRVASEAVATGCSTCCATRCWFAFMLSVLAPRSAASAAGAASRSSFPSRRSRRARRGDARVRDGACSPSSRRRPARAVRGARAGRVRARPGRAALSQRHRRVALERQAALPRPRRDLRLRPLRLFAGGAVRRVRRRRRQHPRARSTRWPCRFSSCRRGAAATGSRGCRSRARRPSIRPRWFSPASICSSSRRSATTSASSAASGARRCSWPCCSPRSSALVGPGRVGADAVATAGAASASTSSATATTTARSGCASPRCCRRRARRRRWARLVIRGLADMVESPAGALWMRAAGAAEYVQTARWNCAGRADREPVDSPLSPVPAAHRLGHRPRALPRRHRALRRPRAAATGCIGTPQFWLVDPAARRRRADRLRGARPAAHAASTSTGRSPTCSRRRAARRPAFWPRCRPPRPCSRRASSTPSTGCRPSSSTT